MTPENKPILTWEIIHGEDNLDSKEPVTERAWVGGGWLVRMFTWEGDFGRRYRRYLSGLAFVPDTRTGLEPS